MSNQNVRNSKFEILRLVAIYIIVLHHYCLHTSVEHFTGVSINRIVEGFYHMGGTVGVDVFVLLTGYYQYNRKFRIEKVLSIEKQVLFYSWLGLIMYIILYKMGVIPISLKIILKSLFPVTYGAYWFITAYLGVYLLSPFLNTLINKLSKIQSKLLLIILFFMESIFPTFFISRSWCNYLLLFVFLYILGANLSIRSEDICNRITKRKSVNLLIASLVIGWGLSIVLIALSSKIPIFDKKSNYFSMEYSPVMIAIALSMFLFVMKQKDFSLPIVNNLAKLTLGVYLIQSNTVFSTYVLWPLLEKMNLYNSVWWPGLSLLITLIIVLLCMVIEYVRQKIFDRLLISFPYEKKICNLCERYFTI